MKPFCDQYGCLQPIEACDLELIRRWRNSDRVRSAMFSDGLIDAEQQRQWFAGLQGVQDRCYLLYRQSERGLGLVYFTEIDRVAGEAHWGFYVGADDAPAGCGTSMCRLGLMYAREVLQLQRIIGEVLADNLRSQSLHLRLGFALEQRRAAQALKEGIPRDVLRYRLDLTA